MKHLRFFEFNYGPPIQLKAAAMRNLADAPFCPYLTTLDFTGIEIPSRAAFAKLIAKCRSLETLILRKSLKKLHIVGDRTAEDQTFDLSTLTSVKYLDISGTTWFTGALFEKFPVSLESLIMDGVKPQMPKMAKHLGRFTKLQTLTFDGGLSPPAAQTIARLPNLKTLAMNGMNKLSSFGPSALFASSVSTASYPIGGGLRTLCLGENTKHIWTSDIKNYLERERTVATLERLEIHSMSLTPNGNMSVEAALAAIGGLRKLKQLEMSMERAPRVAISSIPAIMTSIFRGCRQLESLALKFDFVWQFFEDGHMAALRGIGLLNDLKELSWIALDDRYRNPTSTASTVVCLEVIAQEVGSRLRKLRFGCVHGRLPWVRAPFLRLFTDVAELELVYDPAIYAPRANASDICDFLSAFGDSLEKVSVFGVGNRKRKMLRETKGAEADLGGIETEVIEGWTRPGQPILAGGSMEGIRKHLDVATSFARIGKKMKIEDVSNASEEM